MVSTSLWCKAFVCPWSRFCPLPQMSHRQYHPWTPERPASWWKRHLFIWACLLGNWGPGCSPSPLPWILGSGEGEQGHQGLKRCLKWPPWPVLPPTAYHQGWPQPFGRDDRAGWPGFGSRNSCIPGRPEVLPRPKKSKRSNYLAVSLLSCQSHWSCSVLELISGWL